MSEEVQRGYLRLPAGATLLEHKWHPKKHHMWARYKDAEGNDRTDQKDTGHPLYDAVLIGEPVAEQTFIQWRGTNVCMDLTCPKCGQRGHIDADFVYATKCVKCGSMWLMGQAVTMTEIAPGTWTGCEPIQFNSGED